MNIQIFENAKFRYRLGDSVLSGNNALEMILDPDSPFHDTIGYDYAKTTLDRNRFLDFELMREIINAHTQKHQYAVPPSDVLVMHYRAGDRKRVGGAEIEALTTYVKEACANACLTQIQIVTAFHYGNKLGADEVNELSKENYRNLEKLLSSIQATGMSVSVKSSGGIDEDFCYLSNAMHLLPTKGGYSILAGICNPHRVYPSFPITMAAIRHYADIEPVSLTTADLLSVKNTSNNGKYKQILRLLRTTKPVDNPDL